MFAPTRSTDSGIRLDSVCPFYPQILLQHILTIEVCFSLLLHSLECWGGHFGDLRNLHLHPITNLIHPNPRLRCIIPVLINIPEYSKYLSTPCRHHALQRLGARIMYERTTIGRIHLEFASGLLAAPLKSCTSSREHLASHSYANHLDNVHSAYLVVFLGEEHLVTIQQALQPWR